MKPPTPPPHAFRPAPGQSAPSLHPQVVPARVVQVQAVPVRRTHLDLPTLTVSLNRNRVLLSNELCRQLGAMMRRDGFGDLHHGSRIELEPPRLGRASGPRCWFLDVRPTAPGRLTHTPNTRPQFDSLRTLPRALFHAVGSIPGEVATPGSLKLQLVAGVPETPGYYPLEVVR